MTQTVRRSLAAMGLAALLLVAIDTHPASAQETTTTIAGETTTTSEIDTDPAGIDVEDDDDDSNAGLWGLTGLLGLLGLAGLLGRKRQDDRVVGTTYQAPTGATRANPTTGGAHRENT